MSVFDRGVRAFKQATVEISTINKAIEELQALRFTINEHFKIRFRKGKLLKWENLILSKQA